MGIKNYRHWLFESILYAEDELITVLNNIKDNPICDAILHMINTDVKLNFNRLKLTDKNDLIDFLPDSKVTNEPNWATKGNTIKVGRLIKDMLKRNGHSFTDKQIEEFVTKFKAAYDEVKNDDNGLIRIVSGEDIKTWYSEKKYFYSEGGTLNKSCMRHGSCQRFFGIYTDNPDVCSMVIMLNEDGALVARALLWKVSTSTKNYEWYLDRIYYNKEEQQQILFNWVTKKYKNLGSYENTPGHMSVELKNYSFDLYPYMDTFTSLGGDTLDNYEGGDISLTTTDGHPEGGDVYCDHEGEYYPEDSVSQLEDGSFCHEDNARYSNYLGRTYWHEDVIFVETENDYFPEDRCVWSKHMDQYLFENNAAKVYLDLDEDEYDYFMNDDLNDTYVEDSYSGDYFVIDIMINTGDGEWIKPDNALTCYKSIDSSEYYLPVDGLIYDNKLDTSDSEVFSKDQYNDSLYSNKIYVKEIDFLNRRQNELKDNTDFDEDDFHDKMNSYKEWHNLKMIMKRNVSGYWVTQKLYEYGGVKKLVAKKIEVFNDALNRLFTPEVFTVCMQKAFIEFNDNGRCSWPIALNVITKVGIEVLKEYQKPTHETIDELTNVIKREALSLIRYGLTINKSSHSSIMIDMLKKMRSDEDSEISAAVLVKLFIKEMCNVFSDDDGNTQYPPTFMEWGNPEWVEMLKISEGLTGTIIHFVSSQLES